MNGWIRLVAASTAVLLLGACVGLPSVPYDRSASASVKTIGLLSPKFPESTSVVLASSPTQSFGLVGAAIEAGMRSSRESKLKAALAPITDLTPKEIFINQLVSTLEAQGYAVQPVAVAREEDDFVEAYPSPDGVDALLDVVVIQYGYIAAGVTDNTPYRPTTYAKVQLVSNTKSHKVLMQDQVIYNSLQPNNEAVTIAPDPDMAFADSDALVVDPAKTAQGIRGSLVETATTIGSLLK